ncbi:MAG: DUF475 domain-containing protein [Candidatus Gastranaerophilales bacterium]|nr:DUF475 domain-containing protein [Candidatus Gastranaerophilales bacterium]
MLKYFKGSIFVTVLGLLAALYWGMHKHPGSEFLCVFIVIFLAILEITLSFDNAVVNAMKLEKMTPQWQHRFITWGILIAVFGMRFLFPVLVVAIFSGLPFMQVVNLSMNDVDKYTHYLQMCHAPLVTFGGAFLFMLFLSYFCHEEKEVHWLSALEIPLQKLHMLKSTEVIVTSVLVYACQTFVPEEQKLSVVISGFTGIVLYLLIDGVSKLLEKIAEEKAKLTGEAVKLGFVGFLYLELIDASFSLDGVLGAFAISKDVIIITIGLAIGAMFVRSLTLFMVEKKTLQEYLYLEHGAHWAIGFLAVIMFVSTYHEVPEVVTGLTGLFLVGWAFVDSLKHNKKLKQTENNK